MTTILRDQTDRAPVPEWAVRTARAIALLPLPASVWRLCLVFGADGGYTEAGKGALGLDLVGSGGVVLICVVSEAAALLAFGLVRPWGEVVPRWIPLIAGRPVPRRAVVLTATFGVGALAALWTPLLCWWAVPHDDMTETGALVVGIIYLPLVAWAPLLAALTLSYRRRRLG